METLFMRGQYEYAEALGLSPSYSKAACNGAQENLVKQGVFEMAVLLSNPNRHHDNAYRKLYMAQSRSDCCVVES